MGAKEQSQSLHLQSAFADFEAASGKLAAFYQNLEAQVVKLTEELNSSREAEVQQLREKEIVAGRLGSLLEALPAGVVVLDGAGRIAEFNPAAVDLLGPLTSGGRWIEIVTTAFQPQWDDGHDISLKDGRRVNIATEALHGQPGQILVLKDVTEPRRLQELLNHHRRLSAKTELAASLAHQIRTPLASAMLHTSNLSSRACSEAAHQRAAERAMDAMRQLERLVEDMLTFARGGKLDADGFDLALLLERLTGNVAANTQGGAFRFELVGRVPAVRLFGNTDALLSMMLNLVNNSKAATNGGGRLRVAVELGEATVRVDFEDDGPGIPARDREHVFEPFYTTTSSGTGLGLAVARSIARAHGGDLELDAGFERGARFTLSLPLPQDSPAVARVGGNDGIQSSFHDERMAAGAT
jgi:two-component system, sensor histidine kinase FlrB